VSADGITPIGGPLTVPPAGSSPVRPAGHGGGQQQRQRREDRVEISDEARKRAEDESEGNGEEGKNNGQRR